MRSSFTLVASSKTKGRNALLERRRCSSEILIAAERRGEEANELVEARPFIGLVSGNRDGSIRSPSRVSSTSFWSHSSRLTLCIEAMCCRTDSCSCLSSTIDSLNCAISFSRAANTELSMPSTGYIGCTISDDQTLGDGADMRGECWMGSWLWVEEGFKVNGGFEHFC